MFHKIKNVSPLTDYRLSVQFAEGCTKIYDVKPLFDAIPAFKELKEPHLFSEVTVDVGGYGIIWNDDLDLNSEDIWEDGIETGYKQELDIVASLAENLLQARTLVGMTQKQLAEITGIYQADISKIERGLANPSLNTLKRLADGLGVKIKIEFIS